MEVLAGDCAAEWQVSIRLFLKTEESEGGRGTATLTKCNPQPALLRPKRSIINKVR